MSEPAGVETTKVRMWLARGGGRHRTVTPTVEPCTRLKVAGPATRVTPSKTSRVAPVAVAVPRFRTVTTTSTSLFTTGSDVNWMSADVIASAGQVNRGKDGGRMLVGSVVSRTAPPLAT